MSLVKLKWGNFSFEFVYVSCRYLLKIVAYMSFLYVLVINIRATLLSFMILYFLERPETFLDFIDYNLKLSPECYSEKKNYIP